MTAGREPPLHPAVCSNGFKALPLGASRPAQRTSTGNLGLGTVLRFRFGATCSGPPPNPGSAQL